jgi:hypothetical protein
LTNKYKNNRLHTVETDYITHIKHERFWNNIHQVAQDQKIGKPNNLIVLGTQYLWVLMLCRSFFTPGRDIGSKQDTLIV